MLKEASKDDLRTELLLCQRDVHVNIKKLIVIPVRFFRISEK